MKRIANVLGDLRQCWSARLTLLNQIALKGFTIDNYLREKQMAMLDSMEMEENTGSSKKRSKRPAKSKQPKEPKEKSWAVTLRMRKQGLTPEQIAVERCLALTTIIGHLVKCMEDGHITLDEIITPENQQAIRRAIHKAGEGATLTEIKMLCPPSTTYDEIRLVKEM